MMHRTSVILGIILSVLLASPLQAQDTISKHWDAVLDQYELVCESCLNHRPLKEIKARTKTLEDLLGKVKGTMSKDQMQRFESIRSRYSGLPELNFSKTISENPIVEKVIVVDTIRQVEHIQVTDTLIIKEILASININQNISKSDTLYHIIKVEAKSDSSLQVPTAPAIKKRKGQYFIAVTAPVSRSCSFGVVGGWEMDRYGVWLSAQNNFTSTKADYHLSDYHQAIWTSGNWRIRRSAYCAGVSFPIYKSVRWYAGAGYGEHTVLWEDSDGRWAQIEQKSSRGLAYKAGAAATFGPVIIGAGGGGVLGRIEGELSLGVRF